MTKVHPEIVLDPSKLSETNAPEPRELPKPLADFKSYVDAKFCYHSSAVETATLVNVQPKVAYKYQMKLVIETRSIRMKKETATWRHEQILFSETIGKFLFLYTEDRTPQITIYPL